MKKRAVFRCIGVDSIGASKSLNETIDIPGKIYGTYIEDDDLFALCPLKNEFKLKLLRIRDGSVVDEKSLHQPAFTYAFYQRNKSTFWRSLNSKSNLDSESGVQTFSTIREMVKSSPSKRRPIISGSETILPCPSKFP